MASRVGHGSRFSLLLPVVPAPALIENLSHPDGLSVAADGTWVLVVEDDPLVLPALKLALEALGCTVTIASSAAEARVAARAHTPALIISDFRLPGEDGIQVITGVWAELGAQVPASLLTGDLTPAIEARSRSQNIGLLRKPVRKEDLAALVDRARPAAG